MPAEVEEEAGSALLAAVEADPGVDVGARLVQAPRPVSRRPSP